jgi:hypothetical protein
LTVTLQVDWCARTGRAVQANADVGLVQDAAQIGGSVGFRPSTLLGQGGALAGSFTAYICDWNVIPVGQAT